MILKRIAVSNWRILLGTVELGPFSEGLNVIHARNGTGKSSIFEAMRRGLFDAHHVSGSGIEAVRPWGRELTPSVIIDFVEGRETWRVEKAFLKGATAKILRLEGGIFKPVADSRNADFKIREILLSEAPGRGLSKQQHWGLAQILWAPQGELRLEDISGTASESLRQALGIQISGEGGGRVERRIEERFLQFFTRTGSDYRKGKYAAPILTLQEPRSKLREDIENLQEKYQLFDHTSRTIEDARQRRLQARREADAMGQTVADTRSSAEKYSSLKTQQANKREAESLAKKKYDGLSNTWSQIHTFRESTATLEKRITAKKQSQADLEKDAKLAKEMLSNRRTDRESARSKQSQISERQKLLETARDYLQQSKDLKELEKRVGNLKELEDQLAKAMHDREQILAPEATTIQDLRKWIGHRDQATAALNASQIHLTLAPEKEIVVRNATDNSKQQIKAEESASFSGDAWVDLKVKGFGSIQASGPEGGTEKHRASLEKTEREISRLCQPYGTENPDMLQTLRDSADKLDLFIQTLTDRINTLLDNESPISLKQKLAELRARKKNAENIHTDWKEQPPLLSELKTQFETQSQDIQEEITKKENAFDQAQTQHLSAEKAVTNASADLKITQGELKSALNRLDELLADGLSDEQRSKSISDALMEWNAAKTQADLAEEALKQIPGDPAKELEKLEKQQTALEETESKARDEEKTAEGQLLSLAAEGAYSKLISAQEDLETLETRIDEESIRMDAIKLLYDTVKVCKSRIVASVTAPVERSASLMLNRVAGPRLGNLQLKGDFVPDAVAPEPATNPVSLNNLSGGEQEQLFLVARLALANVVAKRERQLVVLDDVLNSTDVRRFARLLTLLEEVSDRLQIIILTCHPERYRALEGAKFFELNGTSPVCRSSPNSG